MKKFLCMCEGGNVRSVSLACALKTYHQQDAIAIGWRFTSDETKKMLFDWSDYIIVMERYMLQHVPEPYKEKARVVDVGPDNFGYAFHPKLYPFCREVAAEWKARDFKI